MPDIDIDPTTGAVIVKPITPIPPTTPVSSTTPETPTAHIPIEVSIPSFTPPVTPPVTPKPINKGAISPDGAGVKDDDMKETLESALLSIHIGELLNSKKTDIIAVFKNRGMDTMQQQQAWDEINSILVLESR